MCIGALDLDDFNSVHIPFQNGPLCSSRSDEEILELILDTSPAASRLGADQFRIRHFAGTLTYSRRNFPERTDALPKSIVAAMFSASHKWIPQFFPEGRLDLRKIILGRSVWARA